MRSALVCHLVYPGGGRCVVSSRCMLHIQSFVSATETRLRQSRWRALYPCCAVYCRKRFTRQTRVCTSCLLEPCPHDRSEWRPGSHRLVAGRSLPTQIATRGGLAGINQSTLIRTAHALVSLHDDQWMSHSTWWFLTMIVVPNGAFSSNTARPAPRLRHSLLTRPNRLCLPPSHPPSAAAVMADPAQKLGCPHSQEPHLQTLCGPKAMPAALGVPRPCLPPWAS